MTALISFSHHEEKMHCLLTHVPLIPGETVLLQTDLLSNLVCLLPVFNLSFPKPWRDISPALRRNLAHRRIADPMMT
jgi:hypothetical protein